MQTIARFIPRIRGALVSTASALMAGALVMLSGCDGRDAEGEAMAMVQYLPAAVVVPAGQEMAAAEAYAASHPGHQALWGVVSRPLPYYGDHAGLVVREIAYGELRRGMTVVYVTAMGVQAGGLLVSKERNGWRVKDWGAVGVNDRLIDESTIVGVVVMAFVAPSGAPPASVSKPAAPGVNAG